MVVVLKFSAAKMMPEPDHVQVAGFFVQGIHVWISWLKYLSFIYYGMQMSSYPMQF